MGRWGPQGAWSREVRLGGRALGGWVVSAAPTFQWLAGLEALGGPRVAWPSFPAPAESRRPDYDGSLRRSCLSARLGSVCIILGFSH